MERLQTEQAFHDRQAAQRSATFERDLETWKAPRPAIFVELMTRTAEARHVHATPVTRR